MRGAASLSVAVFAPGARRCWWDRRGGRPASLRRAGRSPGLCSRRAVPHRTLTCTSWFDFLFGLPLTGIGGILGSAMALFIVTFDHGSGCISGFPGRRHGRLPRELRLRHLQCCVGFAGGLPVRFFVVGLMAVIGDGACDFLCLSGWTDRGRVHMHG